MKRPKLNYKLYYVLGIIITFVFLFLFALFVSLPLAIKDFPEYLGWVAIVVCMVSFVGIIFGVYLMKKANFLKLNQRSNEEEKAIKELQEKIQDILKYTAVNPTEENDDKEYLRGAIAILSDEEIQLLYLKYEKMLNSEEIGAMLGVGSGAVRMRHKRIVEKLRKKINELRAENGDV